MTHFVTKAMPIHWQFCQLVLLKITIIDHWSSFHEDSFLTASVIDTWTHTDTHNTHPKLVDKIYFKPG